MLSNKGFDLWADNYDRDVQLSEASDEYPFAGYRDVLAAVYNRVMTQGGTRILELGFGTGILAKRLYDEGHSITGVDFSQKMIDIAQPKMPRARLICHDFADGLPECLLNERFDHIICTYAIHHLTDPQKLRLLLQLRDRLAPGGGIHIGDVAFETNAALDACRQACGDDWDDDEIYPTVEVLHSRFPELQFTQISHCAGVFLLPAQ